MVFPTRQSGVLTGHVGAVHSVTYSSGLGQYALTGGSDRKIYLWNPTTATRIQKYEAHGYEVLDIAVSHDNETFASCGGDKLVFLWDVSAATTIRRFEGHWGRINCVDFNAEASVLASGSYDATVKFWDIKSNSRKPIQSLDDAKDSVSDIHIVGHEVVTGSVDGRIRNYDLRVGQVVTDTITPSAVTSVTQTKDGAATLVGALDGIVRLMDKRNGRLLQSYKGHKNSDFRVRSGFDREEAYVISGSEDGLVWVWDFLDGRVKEKLKAHAGKVVSAVAYCPGARQQMISVGTDGTIVVWGERE